MHDLSKILYYNVNTKLMVGDFLNNKFREMRQIVLEDVSPRVGEFELWAPVEAGKDNKRF